MKSCYAEVSFRGSVYKVDAENHEGLVKACRSSGQDAMASGFLSALLLSVTIYLMLVWVGSPNVLTHLCAFLAWAPMLGLARSVAGCVGLSRAWFAECAAQSSRHELLTQRS